MPIKQFKSIPSEGDGLQWSVIESFFPDRLHIPYMAMDIIGFENNAQHYYHSKMYYYLNRHTDRKTLIQKSIFFSRWCEDGRDRAAIVCVIGDIRNRRR